MKLPRPIDASSAAADVAGRLIVDARRAEIDEAGRLSVLFPPRRDAAGGWLVRRCVVQGPADTTAKLYVGEPDPLTLADGTWSGEFDVADYFQPLYVLPTLPLYVVWTDFDSGDDVTGDAIARVELEERGR